MTAGNPTRDDRMREVFAALGIKYELARVAKRYLRTTPEYEQARREKRARAWLDSEAESMGDYLYEALASRQLED